eukprot:926918-Prymnesium_polylepis.1
METLQLESERHRCKPLIVIQQRRSASNGIDPGALFFDSESRAINAEGEGREDALRRHAIDLA